MNKPFLISLFCFFMLVAIINISSATAQTITTQPSTVTAKQPTTFTFNSNFLQLNSTGTFIWNFGDGTSNDTTTTPVDAHTYAKDGAYTITIEVTAPIDNGENWNISSDWQQIVGTYTNTIIVNSTQINGFLNNVASISFSGFLMFALVPIISVAGLIITITLLMKSGEEVDPKIIVAGVILVILVNIFTVVGILIISGVNTAMSVTGFLFSVS